MLNASNFIFFLFIGITFAHLPDYIKKCYRDDPNINNCLLNSAQEAFPIIVKGIPEYDLKSYSPYKIIDWVIEMEGIKLMSNGYTYYSDDAHINSGRVNFENHIFKFGISVAQNIYYLEWIASGIINGKPIHEKGKTNATFYAVQQKYNAFFSSKVIGNNSYYYIVDSQADACYVDFDYINYDRESLDEPIGPKEDKIFSNIFVNNFEDIVLAYDNKLLDQGFTQAFNTFFGMEPKESIFF